MNKKETIKMIYKLRKKWYVIIYVVLNLNGIGAVKY